MKNNNPLISVIIPVYNVEKYIKKCVVSLVKQTYQNCEFIFIDDGSPDNSVKIIRSIQDSRIKIISQINQGVSTARNEGLKVANGKYIVFVDADDYVADDYIEYLYNLITSQNADFAYTINLYSSKKDTQVKNDSFRVVNGTISTGILLSPDVVVGSCNKIYKRQLIEKYNLNFRNDLYYGEGLNFIIRMSLCSNTVAIGQKKILYYRKNNMNSATTKYNNEKYHNGLKSLHIIEQMIDLSNNYVKSMYILHVSTFYLGAISHMIENKKEKEYKEDYLQWRKNLKKYFPFIVVNNYISLYRKCMIFAGIVFPHLISKMNIVRKKNIIKNSVE